RGGGQGHRARRAGDRGGRPAREDLRSGARDLTENDGGGGEQVPGREAVPRRERAAAGRGPLPDLAAHPSGGAGRTGSTKRIVVPAPGVLSAAMDPPCASARLFAMASPRPAPPESAALTNRSNTNGSTSAGIPGPVSATEKATSPP